MACAKFSWGLTKTDLTGEYGLLSKNGLMTFKGKAEEISAAGTFRLQDEAVVLTNPNDLGLVKNDPVKQLFLSLETANLDFSTLNIQYRVIYDVVTLSTAEQAAIYAASACC